MQQNHRSDIKKKLRISLRSQRKALSSAQQEANSKSLLNILGTRPEFTDSQKIAFYWANDGELDPKFLLEQALSLGKNCYLPRLDATQKQLIFLKYTEKLPLLPNVFGILEPSLDALDAMDKTSCETSQIAAEDLDLVLLPLVGFDLSGNRLGRGFGYYDRTFAFLKNAEKTYKTRLIGLGLELQAVSSLPEEAWDIKLSGIATEKRFILL